MRTLDLGFKAHLESGATTLSNCWRLTRGDGVVLGFTDHDRTLSFDGTEFVPAHGLDGGASKARLGGQVDTGTVIGLLHSDAIAEADIALGRYDGAMVETWRVNWRAPEERHLLRRDSIGEIIREDGVFRAELRSAQAALNVVRGRVYQALCDASFGDARCGVDAAAFAVPASVVAVEDPHRLVVAGLDAFVAGWSRFGSFLWDGGARSGIVDRVLEHAVVGDAVVLTFEQPVGDWVLVGDAGVVTAGCDRRFATCRTTYDNAVNFRGFPHIPGTDLVLRVPRAGETLDGRALFS
ncbi:MAG: Transfer Agent FAD/FMN-containing dehydrogenase [Devosia sp.]|nr:Transfer Agent FAD/FMN-containing dehydrogenase [Devosia sp.]